MKIQLLRISLLFSLFLVGFNTAQAQFKNPDASDKTDTVKVEESDYEETPEDFGGKEKKEKNDDRTLYEKIYKGGGVGLSFGNKVSYFSIMPMIGYQPNDYFAFGTGLTYQTTSDKRYTQPINYTIYGGSLWVRVFPIEQITLHAEIEKQYWKVKASSTGQNTNGEYGAALLAGGGYRMRMGGNSFMHFLLLYNLNWSQSFYNGFKTQYAQPLIFRTSINF